MDATLKISFINFLPFLFPGLVIAGGFSNSNVEETTLRFENAIKPIHIQLIQNSTIYAGDIEANTLLATLNATHDNNSVLAFRWVSVSPHQFIIEYNQLGVFEENIDMSDHNIDASDYAIFLNLGSSGNVAPNYDAQTGFFWGERGDISIPIVAGYTWPIKPGRYKIAVEVAAYNE